MEIRTNYPQVVLLADGSTVQMTEDDWRRRRLVVETNMAEREVRRAFEADGFRTTVWEIVKDGQIGHGMVKKFEYCRHMSASTGTAGASRSTGRWRCQTYTWSISYTGGSPATRYARM